MNVKLQESTSRTKSLTETVHLATLQLLEDKLRGKKETHSDEVQTDEPPPLPPPRQEIVGKWKIFCLSVLLHLLFYEDGDT